LITTRNSKASGDLIDVWRRAFIRSHGTKVDTTALIVTNVPANLHFVPAHAEHD